MKVLELIKLLQSLEKPDKDVKMEGCDCYQIPGGEIEEEKEYYLIKNDGKNGYS